MKSMHLRSRHQVGYILIVVMSALALISFVAARFAQRVDQLREQATVTVDIAAARLAAADTRALALYWLSTHFGGPAAYTDGTMRLVVDGRPYQFPDGSIVQVLDQRALLPINLAAQTQLARLIDGFGADSAERDRLMDTLLDYTDSDNLRRLNGAEAQDYARTGLPPPRNEWLLSVRELGSMPYWQDHPEWLSLMERYTSTRISAVINPNLAARSVLAAALPGSTVDQLQLVETLRRAEPFVNGAQAQQATGLPMDSDYFIFHTSDEFALTVTAPGMKRVMQLQIRWTPGDTFAPWLITEVHSVAAPLAEAQPPEPFRSTSTVQ